MVTIVSYAVVTTNLIAIIVLTDSMELCSSHLRELTEERRAHTAYDVAVSYHQ